MIDQYIQTIQNICKDLNIKRLSVFGSVLTEKFNDKSDVDFIVEIDLNDPFSYAENYFELKFQLENLLNCPVDLLEEKALKNIRLKTNIEKTRKVIYAA